MNPSQLILEPFELTACYEYNVRQIIRLILLDVSKKEGQWADLKFSVLINIIESDTEKMLVFDGVIEAHIPRILVIIEEMHNQKLIICRYYGLDFDPVLSAGEALFSVYKSTRNSLN